MLYSDECFVATTTVKGKPKFLKINKSNRWRTTYSLTEDLCSAMFTKDKSALEWGITVYKQGRKTAIENPIEIVTISMSVKLPKS